MAIRTRRQVKRVTRGQVRKGIAALKALVLWPTKHGDPAGVFTPTVLANLNQSIANMQAMLVATYPHP